MREDQAWYAARGLRKGEGELFVTLAGDALERCARLDTRGGAAGAVEPAPFLDERATLRVDAHGRGGVSVEEAEARLAEACAFLTGASALDVRSANLGERRLLRLGEREVTAQDASGAIVIVETVTVEKGVERVHQDGTCSGMPTEEPEPFERRKPVRATWSSGVAPRRVVRRFEAKRLVVECDHYVY